MTEENRWYTVAEYAGKLEVSTTVIRKKMKRGDLQIGSKIIDNRKVTVVRPKIVEVDTDHVETHNEHTSNPFGNPVVNSPGNEKLVELVESLMSQLTGYAEQAGQAKLLIDSERRTQEEYFQVKSNIKTYEEKSKKQEEIIEQKNKENEELKRLITAQNEKIKELEKQINNKKDNFLKKLARKYVDND